MIADPMIVESSPSTANSSNRSMSQLNASNWSIMFERTAPLELTKIAKVTPTKPKKKDEKEGEERVTVDDVIGNEGPNEWGSLSDFMAGMGAANNGRPQSDSGLFDSPSRLMKSKKRKRDK